MVRFKAFCFFILFASPAVVFSTTFLLGLAVKPSSTLGSVQVEITPSSQDSITFNILVDAEGENGRKIETSSKIYTIRDLTPGQTYIATAIGLSSSGDIVESSSAVIFIP